MKKILLTIVLTGAILSAAAGYAGEDSAAKNPALKRMCDEVKKNITCLAPEERVEYVLHFFECFSPGDPARTPMITELAWMAFELSRDIYTPVLKATYQKELTLYLDKWDHSQGLQMAEKIFRSLRKNSGKYTK